MYRDKTHINLNLSNFSHLFLVERIGFDLRIAKANFLILTWAKGDKGATNLTTYTQNWEIGVEGRIAILTD